MFTILWRELGNLRLNSPYEPEAQEIMRLPNNEKSLSRSMSIRFFEINIELDCLCVKFNRLNSFKKRIFIRD